MKNSVLDNVLKWFFIGSSIFYFYNFVFLLSEDKPYFEYLMSFLIEAVAALYFIKKNNFVWVKENMFFLLATMTGLMLTKTFFFYYHGLNYQISVLISLVLIFASWIAFKKYQEEHS